MRCGTTGSPEYLGIPPAIIHSQSNGRHSNKHQHGEVRPMAGRKAFLRFLGSVDPDSSDLTRNTDRDIESNRETNCAGAMQVGRNPPKQWGNTGERSRGGDEEAAISLLDVS